MRHGFPAPAALLLVLLCVLSGTAHAARTDIVFLTNGDRITGEIKRLDRGQLEFKTDDAGTIDIEWDIVSHLEAARVFEVVTVDGRRCLGSLARGAAGVLSVVGPGGAITLPMAEVNLITPIGQTFWRRLDGSIDAGFNYTQSSGIAQLNVNSDTVYRRPAFEGRLRVSGTGTQQDDGSERDDRGSVELSYVRYRWQRWFVSAAGRFESNESLGLRLRSQIGAAVGPRLIRSNQARMYASAGLVLNDERGVDVEATQNVEGLLSFGASYFTYDRPRTNLDFSLQYYPSLSNWGRNRLQIDAAVKREVWKDFFLSVNLFETYDSRPPNPAFDTNDVGIALSLGWSY